VPRGPAPQWKRLKEPLLDEHVKASVNAVDGIPDSETGWYGTLHIADIESRERAKELKQALFRAAKRQGVSMNAEIKDAVDGTLYIEFRAISKAHARAFIIKKYGPDRSKWPYDPRRKSNQDD
jgi:hypothetical protein